MNIKNIGWKNIFTKTLKLGCYIFLLMFSFVVTVAEEHWTGNLG